LSSVALPTFVRDADAQPNDEFPKKPYFDFRKLMDVVKVIVRNLNNLIDKTYHPVPESKLGCENQRAIGIGVQGLDDAYAKMRYPFDSEEAADLNKRIFECMYYAALTASTSLARKVFLKTNESGACKAFHSNGGSPLSKGIFHFELCGVSPSDAFDWETLREHIKKFGVRNSLLIALMPTASTSQLLGNNECFEPYTSNVYTRNTSAGEYVVMKKYLMNDLYTAGLWSQDLKEYIIASEGSIQHIEGIPDELKRLYKTAWEIDQRVLVQQAIDRQPFVDQAQSMNLYVRDFNLEKWNDLMFLAWSNNLKTGKYYLHTEPASQPAKFTIDPKKQKEMQALIALSKKNTSIKTVLRDVCDLCSS
jgi:ribonucleotide reductase alpha subunit